MINIFHIVIQSRNYTVVELNVLHTSFGITHIMTYLGNNLEKICFYYKLYLGSYS